IDYAKGSEQRGQSLIDERNSAYAGVFNTIIEEEDVLNRLYQLLKSNLQNATGSLGKLTFHVRRKADVEAWAEKGEDLLDLRISGPFKGKGTLLSKTKEFLQEVWEDGTAEEAEEAIAKFRTEHEKGLLEHSQAD